jgi:beta-phosphoglucomutase-like phosphatase (HAD superfamily)
MATARAVRSIFQELADLFGSSPTREQVLKFHPSKAHQRRARTLLIKQNEGRRLTDDEQREMDEFAQAELFMGLVKAKLRVQKAPQP